MDWPDFTQATKQNLRISKQLKSYEIDPLSEMKLNYKPEKYIIIWK